MATARKILLVEDDADDAEFLRLSLSKHNASALITHVGSLADAVAALDNERFDIVLLDLNLPDGRGFECVDRIQTSDELVPIVVLSGHGDEDFAVEILNRGVQDYLVKWEGDGRIILRAIRYAIERKRAEIKVNYLARLDWLTCIPNLHYLHEELGHATTRAMRGGRKLALLQVSLDEFATINETHGRETGDSLLKEAVQRISACVPDGDLLARIGGDEFAIVLEDIGGLQDIETISLNIGTALRRPYLVGGEHVATTASVGIAVCPTDGTDAGALLNSARNALRQAREQGPNTFRFFADGTHREIESFRRLVTEIEQGLEQEQFELLYQPQIRLADHRIEAVEALLRWKHPERGQLLPEEFLSVAEESGQIVALGAWVVESACRQLGRWQNAGVPVPRVTINVSATEYMHDDFPECVRSILEAQSIEPGLIELEMAEGSLMDEARDTRERLFALKKIGVRLAIDGFGAGRLSLGTLRRLPLDVLKIDQSFVSNLGKSEDAQVICGSILSIARHFSLDVVAKGIESAEQEAFLTRHDCLYGQGKFFSDALGAEQIRMKLVERGGQATRQRPVTTRRIASRAV